MSAWSGEIGETVIAVRTLKSWKQNQRHILRDLPRRMELAAVEVLAATQLTCLFGFMAWLGANSLAWALGLVALSCAADLFRWFYRYDWQARRFLRNDLDARKYLAELERLLADAAAAQRMNRLHTKVIVCRVRGMVGVAAPDRTRQRDLGRCSVLCCCARPPCVRLACLATR